MQMGNLPAVNAGARIEESAKQETAEWLPKSTLVRAMMREPIPVCEVLVEVVSSLEQQLGSRHPTIRRGQRKPLPRRVWRAVYRRDKSLPCALCGAPMSKVPAKQLQVDHIIPWSAGGPDTTDNLRLVHAACNSSRSNRQCLDERLRLPIVNKCAGCNLYDWTTPKPMAEVWCDACKRVGRAPASWELTLSATLPAAVTKWETVAGREIASHVKAIAFTNGVLTLATDSKVWADQLARVSKSVVDRMNASLRKETVQEIAILVPRRRTQIAKGNLRSQPRDEEHQVKYLLDALRRPA